ncbi:hypothetical protein [Wenxinia marina]|uniref:Uncharacterized protein n=1 Tax=Wenxinia marina DSM 24838 TaxID=1123501 RepID=A0A0D0NL62_9RHOB|nr:hypothetical protein [Wenxinia marina]KIQ69045.1 hypothetical protein Wenmar_02113 [Wenxinia marina DSM 24838]GGL69915.1 hypothetical protein GCM10011392_25540 [Wenxinia marina]
MASPPSDRQPFNVMAVGQGGRLEHEAVLLAASLRRACPDFAGRLIIAEPQPGPLWPDDPRLTPGPRNLLEEMGAEIVPFESRHFGAAYPYGNKIEGLAALPADEPFLFLDTDTLVLGDLAAVPFDFVRPAASMRREGTWPVEDVYWPGYTGVWRSLYDRFGLDFETSLDLSEPDEFWRRYLYFNAGWFFGADPAEFGRRFTEMALSIRDDPPPELALQPLDPWLDQVALPLVIHSLGGGRPGAELAGLDGDVTCHYRTFPLLYARESDAAVAMLEAVAAPNPVKKVLKAHRPLQKMVYQGKGAEVRALFDRAALPRREQDIRKTIRAAGLWMR